MTEVKCSKLTATLIPHPPELLVVGRRKKPMKEVKPRKKWKGEERYF